MSEEHEHHTYGTLDELLDEIRTDIEQGYYPRIGQHGALSWFADKFSQRNASKDQEQS